MSDNNSNEKEKIDEIDENFLKELLNYCNIDERPKKTLTDLSKINFSLSNVSFLTSKLSQKENEYILLNDLKNNGYIEENYYNQHNNKFEKGANFKVITRDNNKKEIYYISLKKNILNYSGFRYSLSILSEVQNW